MVEGTRLESVRTLTGTGGSNPPLSATKRTPLRCPFSVRREIRDSERNSQNFSSRTNASALVPKVRQEAHRYPQEVKRLHLYYGHLYGVLFRLVFEFFVVEGFVGFYPSVVVLLAKRLRVFADRQVLIGINGRQEVDIVFLNGEAVVI